MSPKGLLAAKQKLLARFEHVQAQSDGGLKFTFLGMGLFCSREIDEDYVVLALITVSRLPRTMIPVASPMPMPRKEWVKES